MIQHSNICEVSLARSTINPWILAAKSEGVHVRRLAIDRTVLGKPSAAYANPNPTLKTKPMLLSNHRRSSKLRAEKTVLDKTNFTISIDNLHVPSSLFESVTLWECYIPADNHERLRSPGQPAGGVRLGRLL